MRENGQYFRSQTNTKIAYPSLPTDLVVSASTLTSHLKCAVNNTVIKEDNNKNEENHC